MKNPGRALLILWALALVLTASSPVRIHVEENPVIAGEEVAFSVEAEGERVTIPDLRKVGDYPVTEEGMQRLERMEGGRNRIRWVKYFAFTPSRSVRIEPIRVEVDGRTYETAPLDIRVLPKKPSRENDFLLDLDLSQRDAYVGEPVVVTVRFKESRAVPVMNVDFVPIRSGSFWIKRAGKERTYPEGSYLVHERRYLFFPQKEGNLSIGPAKVKVAVTKKMRDAFGFIVQRPRWLTLQSPVKTLSVRPLPSGVTLTGDFSMEVEASPKRVRKGEPVRLTVRVRGEGNIEDFTLPRPEIGGVTVYGEEPRLSQRYEHGRYSGVWERRFVLISDRSFSIPSFSFRYFDPKNGRIVTRRSDPIAVVVTDGIGGSVPSEGTGATETEMKGAKEMTWIYMNMAGAFLLGMGVMYLLMRLTAKRREKRKRGATKSVAGDEGAMLQKLMPHIADSKEAAQMAENLYASLFEGKAVRVEKKAFEKLMETLKKS